MRRQKVSTACIWGALEADTMTTITSLRPGHQLQLPIMTWRADARCGRLQPIQWWPAGINRPSFGYRPCARISANFVMAAAMRRAMALTVAPNRRGSITDGA
jgi:hypothetical protein